jgi:hypothetical protein
MNNNKKIKYLWKIAFGVPSICSKFLKSKLLIISSKSVLFPYLSLSDCSNTVLFIRQVENLRNDL